MAAPLFWPTLLGSCWLVGLAVIDLATGRLPNILTCSGMLAGWSWHWLHQDLTMGLLGSLCGFGVIFIINAAYCYRRGQLGMGWGDAKTLAMLGSWLGPGAIIPILAYASVIGCGFVFLFFGIRTSLPSRIPFGPCLALGAEIVMTR